MDIAEEKETENPPKPLKELAKKHSNGRHCIYVYGETFHVHECEKVYPCGVCRINKIQTTYYLKGLDDSATGDGGMFDSVFYFDGYRNEKPLFRQVIIARYSYL